MALTHSSLSARIVSEMKNQFGNPEDESQLEKFASAIAKAVVDEFKQNAVIQVNSVSGVTPGSGVSGPGTGLVA